MKNYDALKNLNLESYNLKMVLFANDQVHSSNVVENDTLFNYIKNNKKTQ